MVKANTTFRLAGQQDIAQILAIECKDNPHPWNNAAFNAAISNESQQIWALETTASNSSAKQANQPQIVAYLVGMLVVDEASLLHINVATQYRRRGYAQQLIEHWLTKLREKEIKGKEIAKDDTLPQAMNVWLEVRASNLAAINLYTKLDFEQIDIRKAYYLTPKEDGVIMRVIKSI